MPNQPPTRRRRPAGTASRPQTSAGAAEFFTRANALLDRLETFLPIQGATPDIAAHTAFSWRPHGPGRTLAPVRHAADITLSDLQCIDRQKQEIERNTRQFLQDLPANHALLWGPRGTGKSSLVKALLNKYAVEGLRLIEIEGQYLTDLPLLMEKIDGMRAHFILFCDDLSFEAVDPSYKTLKIFVDGSVNSTPDNLLIYATSNRRHLVPEVMSDNLGSRNVEGELHLSEAVEEKISLSERFGLWLAFHPFRQDEYLAIVDHWLGRMQAPAADRDAMHQAALKWALEHGSRSGRSAWQFARDWTGRRLVK